MRETDSIDETAYNQIMSGGISIPQIFRAGLRYATTRPLQNPLGIIPWSPQARGLLARPYKVTQEQPTVRQRNDVYSRLIVGEVTEADVKIISCVEVLVGQKHCSMVQVAIAWSLKRGVNPIVGQVSAKGVNEAAEAIALASKGLLTGEEIRGLDVLCVAKPEIFMGE